MQATSGCCWIRCRSLWSSACSRLNRREFATKVGRTEYCWKFFESQTCLCVAVSLLREVSWIAPTLRSKFLIGPRSLFCSAESYPSLSTVLPWPFYRLFTSRGRPQNVYVWCASHAVSHYWQRLKSRAAPSASYAYINRTLWCTSWSIEQSQALKLSCPQD